MGFPSLYWLAFPSSFWLSERKCRISAFEALILQGFQWDILVKKLVFRQRFWLSHKAEKPVISHPASHCHKKVGIFTGSQEAFFGLWWNSPMESPDPEPRESQKCLLGCYFVSMKLLSFWCMLLFFIPATFLESKLFWLYNALPGYLIFLSPPVPMHGGLFCITFRLSVWCLSVCYKKSD